MTPPAPRLKNELSGLREFLSRNDVSTLSDEERRSLIKTADDLLEKLAAVEGRHLTVGLLGGTGVGKSSLMNALAGAPISSVSHRRPHTDHVIVYRHQDSPPVPVQPADVLPWREILHQADPVRHVLLSDLPDFDSLLAAHRESVLAFLGNLDLLVWVTSPEKYADRRFYEFLKHAPKAGENFFFVLNKADLLFQEKSHEKGYETLAAAYGLFTRHLQDAGIDNPSLFVISAQEALDSGPVSSWNQFPVLRQQVFQLRNAKQVRTIKEGNLDVEASRLFSRLRQESEGLDRLASALERSIQRLNEDRPAWEKTGREGLTSWLESKPVRDLFKPARGALPLSGPGLALALVFLRPSGDSGGEQEPEQSLRRLSPPESLVSALKRRMEWLEDRIVRHMLEENLAPSFRKHVEDTLRQRDRFEEIGERLFHVASERASIPVLPGMIGFRALQGLTYTLLLVLLLFALGDAAAWRNILEAPGLKSGVGLLSSFIQTLFSAQGLAALASYALLNLFFGVRFLLSYRKRLNKATGRAVASLADAMTDVWTEQLHNIVKDLQGLKADVEARKDALDGLTSPPVRT